MARDRHPLRRALSLLGTVALVFAVVVGAVAFAVGRSGVPGPASVRLLSSLPLADIVAIVPLEGEISHSDAFVETLKELEDRRAVRAVVIRIDSPGGSVGPSQEMFAAVRRLAARKPVVASIGSMAASGGYYVAVGAHRIVANPGSLTGSIGVIMAVTDVSTLLDKLGVRATVLKAGALKDMGSPFRALTPEEQAILQSTLDQVHGQFIEAVATGRNMPVERCKELADGRLYSGQQAKDVGLVDDLGGLEEAVRIAGERAGIQDPRTETVMPTRGPWWWRALASESSPLGAPGAAAAALRALLGERLSGMVLSLEAGRGWVDGGEPARATAPEAAAVAGQLDGALPTWRMMARMPIVSRGLE